MTANNVSPLRYPGGKNALYPLVKNIILENGFSTYIEPFCGGASIPLKLLLNKDVKRIVLNDVDFGIYAFWYSVLYYNDELISLINQVDVSIDEWKKQKNIYQKENKNLLKKGFSTFFLNRTNRSGIITAGPIGGYSQSSNYKINCRFNKKKLIQKIFLIGKYKNKISLFNIDALNLIKRNLTHTGPHTLIFFDPPYFDKGFQLYRNFYTLIDHELLATEITEKMKNKNWILTYDDHTIIEKLYSNYDAIHYQLHYSAGKNKSGDELLFLSHSLINTSHINNYIKIV